MLLRINMQEQFAGNLTAEAGRFTFAYADSYLKGNGIPLSCRMPLRQEAYDDAVAFPFFENLLPDGNARLLAANAAGLDYQAIHSLLQRFGGDVAGAISIVSYEEGVVTVEPRPLFEDQLAQQLQMLPAHLSLDAHAAGQRLSLAGAMPKLPVLIKGSTMSLPGSYPSTHIIKPEPSGFTGLAANEYICMRAAADVGLHAAEVALHISEAGQPYLMVRRYDRDGDGRRLHQEDFCQALGLVSGAKYQIDGGPGLAGLFAMVAKHSKRMAADMPELFLRSVFNLLIGNADAHAKNFSLLYLPSGPQLAPAYDLVCTDIYENLNRNLAMDFGGANHIGEVTKDSLKAASEDANINLTALRPRLIRMVNRVVPAVIARAEEVTEEHPRFKKTVVQLVGTVENNSRKITSLLK